MPAVKIKPFSIAALMAVILFFALGFAGMRDPMGICASAVYSMALASIGVAILGIAFCRAATRAMWIGYFVLAGGHALFVEEPSRDSAAYLGRYLWGQTPDTPRPELITTRMLVLAYQQILPAPELRQGGRVRVQWGSPGSYYDAQDVFFTS